MGRRPSTRRVARPPRLGRALALARSTSSARRPSCRSARPARLLRERRTFEYLNDAGEDGVDAARRAWRTLGDVGYLDEDGYLYLTDRATFMIISGGVNIYPQEIENALMHPPEVADVAVFGVPNDDFGEEVKAVVQPAAGVAPGRTTTRASCSPSPASTSPTTWRRARWTSSSRCPACRPASSTKKPSRTATGANPAAASCDTPPAPCQDPCRHQLLNRRLRGQVIHAIPASSHAAMSSYRPSQSWIAAAGSRPRDIRWCSGGTTEILSCGLCIEAACRSTNARAGVTYRTSAAGGRILR